MLQTKNKYSVYTLRHRMESHQRHSMHCPKNTLTFRIKKGRSRQERMQQYVDAWHYIPSSSPQSEDGGSPNGVVRSDSGVIRSDSGVVVRVSGSGVVRSDSGVIRSESGVVRSGSGVVGSGRRVVRSDSGVVGSGSGIVRSNSGGYQK